MEGAGPRPGGGRGWPAAMGMGRGIICICMGRVPIIGPDSIMPGGIGRPGMPGPGRGMFIPAADNQHFLRHVHSCTDGLLPLRALVQQPAIRKHQRKITPGRPAHAGSAAGKGGLAHHLVLEGVWARG